MKIGIITFQRAHNFGAQMQMYALYTFLKNQGHDVWILDYHCSAVEDGYAQKNPLKPFRRFVRKNILVGAIDFIKSFNSYVRGYQKKKVESFDSFLYDNFQLTKRFEYPEDMPTDFDVLIIGSDQVWNYKITGGRYEPFFLDNGNDDEALPRRIAYAPSCEKYAFAQLQNDKDYLKHIFSKFHWISVREKALGDFLTETINIKADTVLDPTLLLSREDYLKIAIKPKKEHYLCVYRVSASKKLQKVAKQIAKEKGLEIVEIYASTIAKDKAEAYGPREILGYLCYADVIVTSSFHGTAFSIINRKDFYSVYNKSSVRVANILKSIGLENRMITAEYQYGAFASVTFNEKCIINHLEHSKTLLLTALQ
jgi:hypothetical protein